MAAYSPGLRATTWSPKTGSSDSPSVQRVESYSEDQEEDQEVMEPPLQDTSHMNFVDGRCTCCPYGYHIDLDFLRYLESLNSGTHLKNLKKIHRNKKKLRKSMEVFLHHQETNSTPPPDIVNSTETFMHMVDQENTVTNQILEDIDSSVNATLSSINVMYSQKPPSTTRQPSGGNNFSEDEADFVRSPIDQRYRAEAELALQANRADSVSSLESQSTYSSDMNHNLSSSLQREVTTTTTVTTFNSGKTSAMTSLQLANNMANLLPDNAQVSTVDISPATLQAIREQMAISLQRMKELEEQVKAIPVLQVRINVLKEEKRLLGLQIKAKNTKMNMQSRGVGDCQLDDDVEPLKPSSLYSRFQTVTNINLSQLGLRSIANGDIHPPKPAMRSIGIGDSNVFENQVQIAAVTGGTKYHEKEFHTEQSTEISEKEVKTVFLGQSSDSDTQLRLFPPWKSMDRPKKPEPPPRTTRSIGVGGDVVSDSSSNVHVHEKELRTVYIADGNEVKKETRNVGILCKAAMRDVGVTYMYEYEKPVMKNIAIGVGEIGVGDGYFSEGDGTMMSNSSHTTHMALQQMNLAAFHSRHIHINNEQLLEILDLKLRRDVRSVSTQCIFPAVDKAVQHTVDLIEKNTIGCGVDSIDVEVKERVQMKSVACENRPLCMNRLIGTDKGFMHDAATNTISQMITKSRATNTEQVLMYPAAVNTEKVREYSVGTDTEVGVFESIEAIRTLGTNTRVTEKSTCATNTEHSKRLTNHNFDFDITFSNKGVNTEATSGRKNVYDRGINTDVPRLFTRGINTQAPKLVERGINVTRGYMPSTGVQTEQNTITRAVGDSLVRNPSHSIGTGDMPINECENCHNRWERMRPVGVNTEPVVKKSIGVGFQSIREVGHMTEVTSDVYTSKLSPMRTNYTLEHTTTGDHGAGGSGGGSSSNVTREVTGTVKSSSSSIPMEMGSRNVVVERTVTRSGGSMTKSPTTTGDHGDGGSGGGSSSNVTCEVTGTVKSSSSSIPMEMGSRNVVVERTVTRSGGSMTKSPTTMGDHGAGGSGCGSSSNVTREVTGTFNSSSSSIPMEMGSRNVVVERTVTRSGGSMTKSPTTTGDHGDGGSGGGSSSNVTREVTGTVKSSSSSIPMEMGSRNVVVERTVTRSGGSMTKSPTTTGDHGDGGSGGGSSSNVTREVIGTVKSSSSSIPMEMGSRNVVVEKTVTRSGGSMTKSPISLLGQMDDLEQQWSTGSTTNSNNVSSELRTVTSSSMSSRPTDLGQSHGRNIVIEKRTTSSSGNGGDETFSEIREGQGGTQMRVVRHIETSYVGGQPVNKTSNVVLQGNDGPEVDNNIQDMTSMGQSSLTTMTSGDSMLMPNTEQDFSNDLTLNNNQGTTTEYSESVQPRGKGRKVVITETRIERRLTGGNSGESTETTTTTEPSDSNGTLRSIMKQRSKELSDSKSKKEISFSEDVVGGYVSSSSDGDDDQDEIIVGEQTQERVVDEGGSDSDGSQSSISYDEGSYDGHAGKIVYTCKDDESIAQGAPGAKMYDQNIRETYELTAEMVSSCEIYAQWLEDSTQITTKKLNSALAVIQHEWFKVSSTKTSQPVMVEDYLSCLNEFSSELMQQVVNLADVNGNTALHYAVSHCNMEIVNLLLDTQSIDINKQNKAGYTAIMLASLAHVTTDRQRDIIARMFGMGDVNARASQAGQTALMLAVSHGRQDMVQMLLEAAANVNMRDEDGSTALMCASEHGHTDIVKMLLGQPDCDPTIQDNDGSSALSIAMEAGHRDIGVLLYAHVNFKQGSPILGRGKGKRRTPTGSSSSLSSSSSLTKRS